MIDYLYRDDYDDTSELTIEEQNRSSPEQLNLTHQWKDAFFIQLVKYVYGPHAPANLNLQDTVATFTTRHISTLKELQSFHEICKKSPHFIYKFSTLLMERVVQLETELW
ncbi:hypothetical protein BDV37DRAFT_269814 [Aspergillus pseudonomiae]|uniref:Uncharacterized protein n=1 Tax=Aspergillus pseudonomiae TaxID=1506151 RepID=A0A5N7DK33_9EURO|nr:uncharacterized protein BDV37DRAFT_269814 [Aspergillus pseudonomiae]KAE8406787.1 hypothetical protein BDV37DRAFT_269814 [Aspergillus pseudonomiae]